jgi:hypothetical protein
MTKTYPKLSDVGAIHKSFSYESRPFDGELAALADAVFQTSSLNGMPMHYPSGWGTTNGEASNEAAYYVYLAELENLGFDIPALLAKSETFLRSFNESVSNKKSKAAAFFELMKSEWMVVDEDVKKYIDGDSIYELIELVLMHTDTTRARMKAVKRHHENRSMKAEVFVWLDSNRDKFKSMDSAAEAITKQ